MYKCQQIPIIPHRIYGLFYIHGCRSSCHASCDRLCYKRGDKLEEKPWLEDAALIEGISLNQVTLKLMISKEDVDDEKVESAEKSAEPRWRRYQRMNI